MVADFKRLLERASLVQSANRSRRMSDNTRIESWNKTMELDLYRRQAFASDQASRLAICSCVDFYNHQRLHSGLDDR